MVTPNCPIHTAFRLVVGVDEVMRPFVGQPECGQDDQVRQPEAEPREGHQGYADGRRDHPEQRLPGHEDEFDSPRLAVMFAMFARQQGIHDEATDTAGPPMQDGDVDGPLESREGRDHERRQHGIGELPITDDDPGRQRPGERQ